MERRTFVQASVAGICTAAVGQAAAAEGKPAMREIYEYRVYTLKPGKQPIMDAWLNKALLPSLKRYGIGPVGVFVDTENADAPKLNVLIVHPSGDSLATLSTRLVADEQYRKDAADYLTIRANDPAYVRVESSILAAIEGMPKIAATDPSKPRLLNLRIYESHNERANLKKIEMFNKGELAIFKKTGLEPLFFAEAIAGAAMPNLTYMLVFPTEDARKAAWDKFRVDPEWLKLKAMPEYVDKEIVSKITNKILTPTAYSQI